ncbi:MAG TPA: MarR family transcriptional regulator [Symbiobacteriaceae bacterium]|nr:MarR family transcriptional regulator [Symbiobacteriaceae bacterium]
MTTWFDFTRDILERRQVLLQDERRLEQLLARRYNITPSQLAVLLSIEGGGKPLGQIVAELGTTSGNLTGISDRLVDCALVTRESGSDDRRLTYLQLTLIGAELVDRIKRELGAMLLEEVSLVDD